jgi:hypothetical protein
MRRWVVRHFTLDDNFQALASFLGLSVAPACQRARVPFGQLRSSMRRRQANYWESAAASKIEKRRDAPGLLQSDRRRIQPLSRELLKM